MGHLPYLKCSMPNCSEKVGQHDKVKNKNKQVCHPHRKSRKHEVDAWKLDQGCANRDGHYGFTCPCNNIKHPATLDINHIDGNNFNRNSDNIEVLCKMCHTIITIQQGHHKQPNPARRPVFADTGLFEGL